MVELSATMDGAASRAFSAALKEYANSLGAGVATAPRRAAIFLCKTFRNNTRVAKKNKSMTVSVSESSPKWITYKDGKKLPRPLRRWNVTINDRGKTFQKFVYAGTREEMRRSLRELVGTNYYPEKSEKSPRKKGGVRGLAKQSWGWVMHNIFIGSAPDAPWQRRNNDRRNPKDAASESMSKEQRGETISSGYARICNRLDYIVAALKISPDEALRKAANKIMRPIINANLRKAGMSPSEIKHEGHRLHDEWLRQFSD